MSHWTKELVPGLTEEDYKIFYRALTAPAKTLLWDPVTHYQKNPKH